MNLPAFRPCNSRYSLCVILCLSAWISFESPVWGQDQAIAPDNTSISQAETTTDVLTSVSTTEPTVSATQSDSSEKPLSVFATFEKRVDELAGYAVGKIASVFFFDVLFFDNPTAQELEQFKAGNAVLPEGHQDTFQLPLAVAWLIFGAIWFTIQMRFVNIWGFWHGVQVVRGVYDDHSVKGEVSHFQALTAALSATVGLGNIAGVAIAISLGGPGACFWMILAGFLGMSSKFTECTLGQMYRQTRSDGSIMGGAMYYLSEGLKQKNLGWLGKALAVIFALLCIGGSFGGGNAFQVNQSLNAVQESIPFFKDHRWVYGLSMTFLVGIVIIGGIKRIAVTAEKIVPFMCAIYVAACLWILFDRYQQIPSAFLSIFTGAFSLEAGFAGFVGVLVTGFKRAAFSNEAGMGSAPIAHSAAKTDHPVREGFVSLLEPFIDTVVICTMTALVIIITGAWENEAYQGIREAGNGAGLTSRAMGEHLAWFPIILSVAVAMFAYSTMISWSYYGERCWVYLFGDGTSMVYRVLFLIFVFLG